MNLLSTVCVAAAAAAANADASATPAAAAAASEIETMSSKSVKRKENEVVFSQTSASCLTTATTPATHNNSQNHDNVIMQSQQRSHSRTAIDSSTSSSMSKMKSAVQAPANTDGKFRSPIPFVESSSYPPAPAALLGLHSSSLAAQAGPGNFPISLLTPSAPSMAPSFRASSSSAGPVQMPHRAPPGGGPGHGRGFGTTPATFGFEETRHTKGGGGQNNDFFEIPLENEAFTIPSGQPRPRPPSNRRTRKRRSVSGDGHGPGHPDPESGSGTRGRVVPIQQYNMPHAIHDGTVSFDTRGIKFNVEDLIPGHLSEKPTAKKSMDATTTGPHHPGRRGGKVPRKRRKKTAVACEACFKVRFVFWASFRGQSCTASFLLLLSSAAAASSSSCAVFFTKGSAFATGSVLYFHMFFLCGSKNPNNQFG